MLLQLNLATAEQIPSATVGFLAIPGIPEGAQVTATIATFASLGSIIIGVFSIWRHQAKMSTADSVRCISILFKGILNIIVDFSVRLYAQCSA
jgi:hypothetical protein